MAKIPITVMGCRCDRCDHEWVPRNRERDPLACPRCKSTRWNTPEPPVTTYEDFKTRVESILRKATEGLTWTQIRTAGRLRQKLPNNQWVRRLESDIGLIRERKQSVMVWRVVGREDS